MSRKNNSSSNHEASNAFSYVRDFSVQACNYHNNRSEESLVLLNRIASLLSTAILPHHFSPENLEKAKFFIDLHAVMGALTIDSDALWTCVGILQHCAKNLEARKAIVDDYRFVPLLTFILKRTQATDKRQRLLNLLQDLTFGIKITWEEPYIVVLLEQLVQYIYEAAEEGEEVHAQLSLSILINLCYKNFLVLFLSLRSVNVSSFSRRIQNYGMLANKMLIVLSEDTYSPDEKELHVLLRSSFAAIGDCVKHWNVPHLRHIVEFLKDSRAHSGLHQAVHTNFSQKITDLVHPREQSKYNSRRRKYRELEVYTCALCKTFHSLRFCRKFLKMSVTEREEVIKKHKYCVKCLARSHVLRSCTSMDTCRRCDQFHHTLLHSKGIETKELRKRQTQKTKGRGT